MYDVHTSLKKHGKAPRRVVVLHGGPGAPGSAAQLARDISSRHGVLEPWQRADSVEALVAELACVLRYDAGLPATLVGHSWGALLGYMLTARHPELVNKLVMIGAPPFEARHAKGIMPMRMNAMSEAQREDASELISVMADKTRMQREGDQILVRFGRLMEQADAYNPLPQQPEPMIANYRQFSAVMGQVTELRRSGALIALGESIRCPVVALHGEYDSHPVDAVRRPLGYSLTNFRCVVLPNCGHTPWQEREARAVFYECLFAELES